MMWFYTTAGHYNPNWFWWSHPLCRDEFKPVALRAVDGRFMMCAPTNWMALSRLSARS